MKITLAILLATLYSVPGMCAVQETAGAGELIGSWQELPLPSTQRGHVSSYGLEPGGVLWVMGNKSCYFWDGKQFQEPANVKLSSGQYLTRIFGGCDRGLYATQRGKEEHQGKLYKLIDGEALYVTDFYFDVSHEDPALYVSKSGRLFNWGDRFLAAYVDKEWKRIESPLSLKFTLVFDTGEKVHFYYNEKLVSVDKDGNFSESEILTPIKTLPGRKRIHGALWGNDRMLILDYGSRGVFAYDLNTGKEVDTEQINSELGERNVYDVFWAGDGSAWVLTNDRELRTYIFHRISPEGEVQPIPQTAQLGWDNSRCWQFPRSVLNSSDGSIWFGLPKNGIAQYKDGELTINGWRQGVGFGGTADLMEGPRGEIYAATGSGVSLFTTGSDGAFPAWVDLWDEYMLTSSQSPIVDSNGNMWMWLKDHPGEISRWDGKAWHHMKV